MTTQNSLDTSSVKHNDAKEAKIKCNLPANYAITYVIFIDEKRNSNHRTQGKNKTQSNSKEQYTQVLPTESRN